MCNFQLFLYYQNWLSRLDRGGLGRLLFSFLTTTQFDPRPSHFYTFNSRSSDHCKVCNSERKQTFDANVRFQDEFSSATFVFEMSEALLPVKSFSVSV